MVDDNIIMSITVKNGKSCFINFALPKIASNLRGLFYKQWNIYYQMLYSYFHPHLEKIHVMKLLNITDELTF